MGKTRTEDAERNLGQDDLSEYLRLAVATESAAFARTGCGMTSRAVPPAGRGRDGTAGTEGEMEGVLPFSDMRA